MKRTILALLLAVAVHSPMAALAELSEQDMEPWRAHAEGCGQDYQAYAALEIEQLLGDLKGDMLRSAQAAGADESQIDVLGFAFEEGRQLARNQGQGDDSHPPGLEWVRENFISASEIFRETCVESP